ncbi:MAG: polysaccharide biosynthesis C-terminal domain-containing protein [Methyloceanibacter sp.]|uniref:polysaccharide biosynthesis C-terminal domain-containing protein n=1 Tax=Methyloceanibacter sp. TaxID=1965321 RepID=UPI003D6D409C
MTRSSAHGSAWLAPLLSRAGRLFTTPSLLSLARVAGALAGFVTQVVLARTLHASALGVFYSVTSLAAVVGLMAAHGYPSIAPRFMSRYREQGKEALIAAFVARARKDAAVFAAVATAGALAFAVLWPSLSLEARFALIAAALSIPANAALRLNGSLAAAIRRFALAYLPDTCIRPFLLFGGVLLLIALGVTLTAGNVTWLLTVLFTGLALAQYLLLRKDLPKGDASRIEAPPRLVKIWRREAKPLILVALFTFFFADVAILMVTPLMTSADTAIIGLCLKLALLVGFAVQVAHQVVVPDLADAHARKEHGTIRDVVLKALAFPLVITIAAIVVVALWGETLLGIFGPEFTGAKMPLLILLFCQLARAVFGPSVPLLTVIGAQRENAALAVAAIAVLAVCNLALVPTYGVLGAAVAVAIATLFWLAASAVVLARLSGLRTDAVYLVGRLVAPRSAPV